MHTGGKRTWAGKEQDGVKRSEILVIYWFDYTSVNLNSICHAKSFDPCWEYKEETDKLSLAELIKRSEFIAVYVVSDAKYSEKQIFADSPAYDYKLFSTGRNLKGDAPNSIVLTGLKPPKNIPPHYFVVLKEHDEINPDRVGGSGSTWPEKLKGDKGCTFAPSFVRGYEYLIFSYGSRISYEPIFSTVHDNWYKIVKEEIGKQRKVKK